MVNKLKIFVFGAFDPFVQFVVAKVFSQCLSETRKVSFVSPLLFIPSFLPATVFKQPLKNSFFVDLINCGKFFWFMEKLTWLRK